MQHAFACIIEYLPKTTTRLGLQIKLLRLAGKRMIPPAADIAGSSASRSFEDGIRTLSATPRKSQIALSSFDWYRAFTSSITFSMSSRAPFERNSKRNPVPEGMRDNHTDRFTVVSTDSSGKTNRNRHLESSSRVRCVCSKRPAALRTSDSSKPFTCKAFQVWSCSLFYFNTFESTEIVSVRGQAVALPGKWCAGLGSNYEGERKTLDYESLTFCLIMTLTGPETVSLITSL